MYRLLIVDDDPSVLEALSERPEWGEMGFEVAHCAESGEEAARWLEENQVDAVLTDVVMCGMSGVDLARMLWEDNSPAHVVFLSGHQEFSYAQKALAYGVSGYLLKPLQRAELLTALNELRCALDREVRPVTKAPENSLEARVSLYVRGHLSEDLSIGRVAEAMHYSERHFRRQFTALGVGSFTHYVHAARVEEAKKRLRAGEEPARVALAVGYSGERYFRQVFRELTGELPAVWQFKNRR